MVMGRGWILYDKNLLHMFNYRQASGNSKERYLSSGLILPKRGLSQRYCRLPPVPRLCSAFKVHVGLIPILVVNQLPLSHHFWACNVASTSGCNHSIC